MSAMATMTRIEFRLFFREHAAWVTVLVLPVVLVLGFGAIPGFGEPTKDLSGQTGTEFIASISVAIALAVLGLSVLPTMLATYREAGVLRRLAVTPARPAMLLVAQLVVGLAALVLSMVLVVGVGAAVYGVPIPAQFGGFLLVLALGTAALFGIGLVIAALAPSSRAATGIGMSLFFPSMFLGGIYVPHELMPTTLQRIGDLTPFGAATQALRQTWHGEAPRPLYLVTMAVYAVVAGLAATRFFRWD